jgi:hypothetical protein
MKHGNRQNTCGCGGKNTQGILMFFHGVHLLGRIITEKTVPCKKPCQICAKTCQKPAKFLPEICPYPLTFDRFSCMILPVVKGKYFTERGEKSEKRYLSYVDAV